MQRFSRLTLLFVLLVFVVGCVPAAPSAGSQKSVQSEKPRAEAPQVNEEDLRALSSGNTAFALDLYHALNQPGQNSFYSPYSISLALAMTYGGARGETAAQMADTLNFTLPNDRLHPAFNALDQELASRKEGTTTGEPGGADGKGFRLNIVNDIWGQEDAEFLAEYLDLLAVNYGAGLRPMNFVADPEAARKAINDYIAEKTEQRIKDLIPNGAINDMTRLVLTNAIYFNAAWLHPFEEEQTQDAPFTTLDGAQVSVPMMQRGAETTRYLAGDGFQAAALPYENSDLSMLLLVPDEGNFEAFEDGLDGARLESILAGMQYAEVMVSMPRFKVESSFQLGDTLAQLGMVDAFQAETADFSGITGKRDLYISSVVHKAFVAVDEAGTEAAAATAVIMEVASAPMEDPIQLTIDRPFILLIRDEPTGAVLFAGRVLDPIK